MLLISFNKTNEIPPLQALQRLWYSITVQRNAIVKMNQPCEIVLCSSIKEKDVCSLDLLKH